MSASRLTVGIWFLVVGATALGWFSFPPLAMAILAFVAGVTTLLGV